MRKQAVVWGANIDLSTYADDGIPVTIGHLDAVAFLHSWASRLLLQWIRHVLHKETAAGKLHCIVSSGLLRKRLAAELSGNGFSVDNYGELLGMGFAAGAKIKKRVTNASRLRKALRRKGRIRWLRDRGGKALRVVKEGVKPAVNYEAPVSGIDNRAMRMVRRAHGATCRIRCGGASLTTRLAIGGESYKDIDPFVIDGTAPVIAVLSKLWDEPRRRAELVPMWRQACDEVAEAAEHRRWRNVRGMVGASMAHIMRIGGRWVKPYVMEVLGHNINILETPPPSKSKWRGGDMLGASWTSTSFAASPMKTDGTSTRY